jgi:hypothetical protein
MGGSAVWIFFAASMAIYILMRIYRIEDFPIYFFTDEAIHWVQFKALVANHWHADGDLREFLPAYFMNGGMYNLSLSVYVQGIAGVIFGPSVETVRVTSALVSATGAVALALTLRRAFRIREWWVVVPILAVLPCWFLHSRTGFETVLMVSAYSWFIYFYALYRCENPRWVFAAMMAGAAVFYAYSPGQKVMLMTALLLLVSDARYHLANRKWFLAGLVTALVLFVPYARFRWMHPEMLSGHLEILDSYWVKAMPLHEKLLIFFENYLKCLSPVYWFTAGGDWAVRHVVPGNAHLPVWLAPVVMVGLVLCVRAWRQASHRLILIALVAAPLSSALVGPMVTRMLAMVVPVSLCAALGWEYLVHRITDTRWVGFMRVLVMGGLLLAGGLLVRAALRKPANEGTNYGLYGLQWGAQAIFRDMIPRYLKTDGGANIILSSSEFNSPAIFPDFFGWSDPRRITFSGFDQIAAGTTLPRAKDLVLLSHREFTQLANLAAVKEVIMREAVSLPDGSPGFDLVQIRLDPVFVAAMEKLHGNDVMPFSDRAVVGGLPISFSMTGVQKGRPGDLVSEDGAELVSKVGEPINLELFFDSPVRLKALSIYCTGNAVSKLKLWGFEGERLITEVFGPSGENMLKAEMNGGAVDRIRIELSNRKDGVNLIRRIVVVPEDQNVEVSP